MKIRNLSKLALAVAISSSVVLEGCKKYDDDITRLEQSIEQNKNDIAALKTQLQSLAANNVVESVTAITGGFRIVFKSPTGQTTTYDIVNGAKGDTGATGPQGPAGTPGAAGANGSSPIVNIGPNGNFWISNNGQAAVDTGVKAQGPKGDNGQDGKDGVDGTVVTIVSGTDGKKYWALNGIATTVQAYAGDIALEETDGGYNVVFTDSKGVTGALFLAKEQTAVSSLSLEPKYIKDNTPVVFFPRIVDNLADKKTQIQGYGEFTYNLNPYGVNPDFYEANGLVSIASQEVEFRSGSSAALNPNFSKVGSTSDYKSITVQYKPSTSSSPLINQPAGTSLQIALQLKNKKATGDQQYVNSTFNLAKEEIITNSEVTIEKFETQDGKVVLKNGVLPNINSTFDAAKGYEFLEATSNASNALPHNTGAAQTRDVANFRLHYKNNAASNLDNNSNYQGAIKLNDELKPFFVRGQVDKKIHSFDDNGFKGSYTLKYDLAAGNHANVNDWLNLSEDGVMSVKISTANAYNIATVGNSAYVRVRLFPTGSSTAIATRVVRVDFVQSQATTVNVVGNITHKMVSNATPTSTEPIVFETPSTLEAAYNTVGKTAADFHSVYTFTPTSSVTGVNFVTSTMGTTGQADPRNVEISNTVMPGTYTITGKYTSSISSDPEVLVTVKVKVETNALPFLQKRAEFWNGNTVYVNGRNNAGNWTLEADLWDVWEEITTGAGSPIPNVTYEFILDPTITGITVNASDVLTLDPNQATALAHVNGAPVKVSARRLLNGVFYDKQDFYVQFQNPVKAIQTKTAYKQFVDKENSGTNASNVDVRRLVTLKDFNGTVIYDFNDDATNVKNTTLINRYGISEIAGGANNYNLLDVSFVRYENASGSEITAPSGASASVVGQNLRWTNSGANLQQAIYLVFKVKLPNTWDTTSEAVVKEIKLKVNPNSNL